MLKYINIKRYLIFTLKLSNSYHKCVCVGNPFFYLFKNIEKWLSKVYQIQIKSVMALKTYAYNVILYNFWIYWMIQNVAKIKIDMKKSSKLFKIISISLHPVISKIYDVKT